MYACLVKEMGETASDETVTSRPPGPPRVHEDYVEVSKYEEVCQHHPDMDWCIQYLKG